MTSPPPYDDSGDYSEAPAAGLPAFLLDPRGVLQRRWRWMLLTLVVGTLTTGSVVYSIEPTYAAEASVLITSQEIPQEFVRSTVRESTIANLNATVSQVLSDDNLGRIIQKYNLYPSLRNQVPLSALVNRMRASVEMIPERSVAPGPRGQASIVYRLSYESGNAASSASVANALASLVVEASIIQRNEQAQRVTRFLRTALEDDERELREQSQLVTNFRRANRGKLPEELDTNMRKLEMLEERRAGHIAQIAEAEGRILELRSRRSRESQTHNEALLDEMRAELARESALNTDEHPNVMSLRNRVEALEEVVERESGGAAGLSERAATLVEVQRREIRHLRKRIGAMDDSASALAVQIDRTPAVSQELNTLEQKEQVLREDYLSALRKVEEAELAETLEFAQQGAQVSILNRAQVPGSPTKPRWLLVFAGLAGTVALALGIAVLFEVADPVMVSEQQLEQVGEQIVLGSLPWVGPR